MQGRIEFSVVSRVYFCNRMPAATHREGSVPDAPKGIDPSGLRPRGTTFTGELSLPGQTDLERDGVNAVMHRPVDVQLPEFRAAFTLRDWRYLDVRSFLRRPARTLECALGRVGIRYDKKRSMLAITAEGCDHKRTERGMDLLAVNIPLDPSGRVMDLVVCRIGIQDQLTRSMLSLLLAESGFDARYPELSAAIREQNVLPVPSVQLQKQEQYSYSSFSLQKIAEAMNAGRREEAIQDILALRLSKCQEIRRLGVLHLELLYEKDWIPKEMFVREREAFFREDVFEDLRFIERTLRTEHLFVRQLFSNLFNRQAEPAELVGSHISLRYFGRGCNKQIYPVEWTLPDGQKLDFAVSAIRDNTMQQGDFGMEEIFDSINNWERLCSLGCKEVVRFGASQAHSEWRRRSVVMHNGYCEVLRLAPNNIILAAREFVPDAVPLTMILAGEFSAADKDQAKKTAAEAYWRTWFISRDGSGHGLFFTTPRAEDIVMKRDRSGRWQARIVDLDTLRSDISRERALAYFDLYSYYDKGMIRSILAQLETGRS